MSHQWKLVLSSSFKLSHLERGKMPHPWQIQYQHSCSISQTNQNDLCSHGIISYSSNVVRFRMVTTLAKSKNPLLCISYKQRYLQNIYVNNSSYIVHVYCLYRRQNAANVTLLQSLSKLSLNSRRTCQACIKHTLSVVYSGAIEIY